MRSLMDSFNQELPPWLEDIKKEVREKVKASPIIRGCAEGDRRSIQFLMSGYWLFVDEFPKSIAIARDRVVKDVIVNSIKLLGKFRVNVVSELLTLSMEVMGRMKSDEGDHRALWLKTAHSVGLQQDDLERQETLTEVITLNELVQEKTNFFTIFLRFVAVEMVAEEISRVLLESPPFKVEVNEDGLRWFKVHVIHDCHKGMTHEELAFRLAIALQTLFQGREKEFQKEEVRGIIMGAVDVFDNVGRKCSELASVAPLEG